MPSYPAQYTLTYYTPGYQRVGELVYSRFSLTCKENDAGTLDLSIPPGVYGPNFFKKDGIITVVRTNAVNSAVLVANTIWFIRRIRFAVDGDWNETVEITAQDAMGILKRRVVAYFTETAYSKKIDFADDMIKDIIRENYSAQAIDADRDVGGWLYIEENTGSGPIVTREVGWNNIWDALTNIAEETVTLGRRVIFSVEALDSDHGILIIRTAVGYKGADHTQNSTRPVIVSQDLGNLSMPELILDWTDEKNAVYATGAGTGDVVLYEVVTNATSVSAGPFSRTELVINGGDKTDKDVLTGLANSGLGKNRGKLIFNGLVLDTPTFQYDVDFKFGDLVTAQYRGYTLDCVLNILSITYDQENGEQINLSMHAEMLLY